MSPLVKEIKARRRIGYHTADSWWSEEMSTFGQDTNKENC